ncbi:hypothetical protein L7F22_045191 [Adiantum nelumboides]|nr:hypothetical protein [Adiantum nelumboides]
MAAHYASQFFHVKPFIRTNVMSTKRENRCLYGLSNETWKVTLPEKDVPSKLFEPALDVNLAWDEMLRCRDWLALVAVHSDAWLTSITFLLGARFDRKKRKHLFQMINIDIVARRVGASVKSPPANLHLKSHEGPIRDFSNAFQEEDLELGGNDEFD